MNVRVVVCQLVDGDEPWVHGVYADPAVAKRVHDRLARNEDVIVRINVKRLQNVAALRGAAEKASEGL